MVVLGGGEAVSYERGTPVGPYSGDPVVEVGSEAGSYLRLIDFVYRPNRQA